MEKIVILISTRRYLPKSEKYIDLESNKLDEFVTSSDILDEVDKLTIKKQSTDKSVDLNISYAKRKRYKVWNHEDASYQNYNYQTTGFKVRKIKSELTNGETQYVIYIAPCTSGILGLNYQKQYVQKLTEIVKEDCPSAKKYYLIAHDKDVSSDKGCGICIPIYSFTTYKYQHEEGVEIYSLVKASIIKPTFEVCRQICETLEAASVTNKIALLSQLNVDEAVSTTYKELSEYGYSQQ